MNRSTIIGLLGGIGIATAGGVAGYTLLSQSGQNQSGTAVIEEGPAVEEAAAGTAVVEKAREPAPAPAPVAAQAPAPAPRPAAAPRPAPVQQAPAPVQATASVQASAPAPEPVVEQRCWDEEVTVQAEPKDDNRIAGTAAGAVLGGAIAKRLGDDNDLATAAGAAAGALAGRRLQRRVQENNTETVIERRCEPLQ